jgi:hypothetical protein
VRGLVDQQVEPPCSQRFVQLVEQVGQVLLS